MGVEADRRPPLEPVRAEAKEVFVRARTLGPLRAVIAEFTEDNGIQRERLECGHVINRKQDVFGHTNAYRRRCRYCRATTRPTPKDG